MKDMILQEAENLAFADLPIQMTQEKHGAEKAKTGDYNHGKNAANHNANHNRYQTASTVARLFASLVQLLYESPDRHKISKIDRKLLRQIDEKRLAQGMKLEETRSECTLEAGLFSQIVTAAPRACR